MLKMGKRYNVSFAAIKLSNELKHQLPIWYHLNSTTQLRRLDNTKAGICLRRYHGVRSTLDLVKAAHEQLNPRSNQERPHRAHNTCRCQICLSKRQDGCKHPETCRAAASRILRRLSEKWHPNTEPPNDDLTLTHHRREKNKTAQEEKKGTLIIDPSVTARGGIAEAFRVFVHPDQQQWPPAIRPPRGLVVAQESTTVY
ncbi:hypothetical protein FOMPIDRAFT_1092838, partial [Fomitopsis schrenkii]